MPGWWKAYRTCTALKMRIENRTSQENAGHSRPVQLEFCENYNSVVKKKEIEEKLTLFKKKIKKKFEVISVITDKNLVNIRKILLKNANK